MEASSKGPAELKAPAARGTVGRQTFELAHDLISSGKKPTEAFAIVAEQTGRSAATVATAYYRVARTIPGGAGVKQRPRRGRRSAPAVPAKASRARRTGTTTSELLRQLVDAAAALGQHVERLERENAEYRKIAAALERVR